LYLAVSARHDLVTLDSADQFHHVVPFDVSQFIVCDAAVALGRGYDGLWRRIRPATALSTRHFADSFGSLF
jgi:hypothetical protein